MLSHSVPVLAALSVLAGSVTAQTPPTTSPSTSNNLAVTYGSTVVTPNILLSQALVATKPDVYSNTTYNGTHMAMLVDLSISANTYNVSGPKAAGLEYCRTTRLHWLQTDLTQLANGSFVSESAAIADYGGPMPPLNDIPHTYTFYLFAQPANFSLPAWDAGRIYNPISVSARMNFSVTAVAAVPGVGPPLAATYIRVQNPLNNATGTASNGTCLIGNTTSTGNTTTSATPTATPYTGAAAKVQGMVGAVMVGVMGVAFALL